jgi:hypothetical protein
MTIRVKVNPRKARAVREAMLRNRYRVGRNQMLSIFAKYDGCEYDGTGRKRVRKLSRMEIEDFRRTIALKIERKERAVRVRPDVAAAKLLCVGELDKTRDGKLWAVKRHPKKRARAASRGAKT